MTRKRKNKKEKEKQKGKEGPDGIWAPSAGRMFPLRRKRKRRRRWWPNPSDSKID